MPLRLLHAGRVETSGSSGARAGPSPPATDSLLHRIDVSQCYGTRYQTCHVHVRSMLSRALIHYRPGLPAYLRDLFRRGSCSSTASRLIQRLSQSGRRLPMMIGLVDGGQARTSPLGSTKTARCWTDLLGPPGLPGLARSSTPNLHPMIAGNLLEIADMKSE